MRHRKVQVRSFRKVKKRQRVIDLIAREQLKQLETKGLQYIVREMYSVHAEYHFTNAIQINLCAGLLNQHGASEEDHKWFLRVQHIEFLWPHLSTSFRTALCTATVGQRFEAQDNDSERWYGSVSRAMFSLYLYSSLSHEAKNRMLDRFFPENNLCSKPPTFPDNLHLHRTKHLSAAMVIGSMSANNWSAWEGLLFFLVATFAEVTDQWSNDLSFQADILMQDLNRCAKCGGAVEYCQGHRLSVPFIEDNGVTRLWAHSIGCRSTTSGSIFNSEPKIIFPCDCSECARQAAFVRNFLGREKALCNKHAAKWKQKHQQLPVDTYLLIPAEEYSK